MIKGPVYILGIGGIGTSAIAQWLQANGLTVTGSDAAASDITTTLGKIGIPVTISSSPELPPDTTTLIYTDAAPATHPLREQAAKKNIPQLSYAAALGELTRAYKTIAIAGSHGKSSTTAMCGLMAEAANLDPTVIVGTLVPQWRQEKNLGNFRAGQSQWCIVEADEYRNHFHYLTPTVGIITSLDHDHVDAFPTPADYLNAFKIFISRFTPDGTLVIEHTAARQLAKELPTNVIRYSLTDQTADLHITNRITKDGRYHFTVVYKNQPHPDFTLAVPGQHMVSNALAAIGAVLATGGEPEKIIDAARTALANFTGTWRRFEFLKEINGALAFSDYAHHPTEVAALLTSAHEKYPDKRLVLVFQPHHGDRTRAFANDFLAIFKKNLAPTDRIILCPIYGVLGRENAPTDTTVEQWATQLGEQATLLPALEQLSTTVRATIKPDDIILFTGAGTIDSLARQIQ